VPRAGPVARVRARPRLGPALVGIAAVVATAACDVRLPSPGGPAPRIAAAPTPAGSPVVTCGLALCVGRTPWYVYGASVYGSSDATGVGHPEATVGLARRARLDAIRVVNFYPTAGRDLGTAYGDSRWRAADRLVAAAAAARLRVLLDLSDFRNLLWDRCVDPYTYDWGPFLGFVAARRNTVTGALYGSDPAIALVSLAGEPLPAGSHTFATAAGAPCTITYSAADLTGFYARTLGQWKALSGLLVHSGGLGDLAAGAPIDWRAIFSLPQNDVCAVKTYGRMIDMIGTVAGLCRSLGKPWIDEEFGWQQSMGDAARATELSRTNGLLRASGAAGQLFWNLGYQVKPTSYDVGPPTPLAFAEVQRGADDQRRR
jgi:hypothetical protein